MPETVTPEERAEERRLIAQIAAHSAACLGATNTEAARAAMWQKYLDQVDPNGVLSPQERERRAVHARKADMARLALKSAQVRRRNRQAALKEELFGAP